VLDVNAYLERIGLHGHSGLTLAEVHRAHATSIPFENLDPHRGVPVSLAPENIERKLVSARRGGYCFEQNLLLKAGLEELGMDVELMLARVRFGAPPGELRGRSHLVLRVAGDDGVWHADVGFGAGGQLDPLPFGVPGEYEQSGWRFRVAEDHGELVLQSPREGEWIDLYGFVPAPVPFIDVQMSNWFTSTYPRSPFVTGLTVSAYRADGSRVSLNNWSSDLTLAEETPAGVTVTPVDRAAVPELIATRFGLHGFVLGEDGRLALDGAG
jgi:N-hydroxyarylamine O-acetyltransferase